MKTIGAHSHSDRENIIKMLVPHIKDMFGDNLVALAVCCSFARNDDSDYSDLELTAFVKEMPDGKSRDGVAKIYDGMLIELIWMTRETYLQSTLDLNEYWHYSGSDTLVPIINEEFIREIASYQPKDLKKKCLDQAVGAFTEVQEATAKVLTAIAQSNRTGIPLLFFEMLNQFLRILSFLNQTPYTTASGMIAQVRYFPIQPASLAALLEIADSGEYQDFVTLRETTIAVFEELEMLFESLDLPLEDDNLDPDKPVHEMRKMQ